MASKTIELQNKVNRLQKKNAELILFTEAVQSFTKAETADRIINRFLVFCTQITGAKEVFFFSNKESSRRLMGEVFGPINCETYNLLAEKTRNHGVTVNESNRNWTAILMPGEDERFVMLADLPLPEKSTEYIEIVSRVIDPFVLALREKEAAERLVKSERALREIASNLERLVEERTKKLELSSLYARNLIEASLDPLVTISVEGKITDVNKATEIATDCSREQLIGSDFSDYFTEPEKANAGYKQVLKEGFVRDYPLSIKSKSGKITNVLYNATVFRNEEGKIQGIFAAARDITELKKAEEHAQEAEKKLRNAERLAAIGATAGMVGHDIRNPLQAITSDVYLSKVELASVPDMECKTNALESLTEIEKNIDYINKIVQDLQDYARPLNPRAQETDIKSILDEILTKNRVPKNIKVDVKVEDTTKEIMADPDYLKRIFANLTLNAVQAMPNGGKLTIHAYPDKQTDDVLITVKDTGVGIPEDVKSKLFTPMMTTKSKGQGFGLAVVKRMTEGLGGTVTFESEEGKGTTFIVRLPPPKS